MHYSTIRFPHLHFYFCARLLLSSFHSLWFSSLLNRFTQFQQISSQQLKEDKRFLTYKQIIDVGFTCSTHLSKYTMSKISVRFLIDKEQKRVVFAEAGSDFVDVLLIFLTLPLGRIVQLLSKQSDFGSLDSLYKSVEQLDTQHFQTEACKEMLLNPRSASAELCENLKIKNIHDLEPGNFFTCSEFNCLVHSTIYYTYIKDSQCNHCGKKMHKPWDWDENTSDGGVFVNKNYDFIISHDLRIMPSSLTNSCSLLTELQIKDASILEERVIDFGTKEALNLLRRSLVSKNALTEVCFPDDSMQTNMDCSLPIKEEMDVNEAEHNIILKLFLNKKNNNVLYAEVGEEFVNHLLSLLTLPLGSVFRFLPDNISLGSCIINLYKSVEIIGLNYFKSEICRNMLLAPKLPTFYGLENQFLEMEEIKSREYILLNSCSKCYMDNGCKLCTSLSCIHGIKQAEFIEQNPKSSKGLTDDGEVFMVSPKRFMVADNLHISPCSLISIISNGIKLPISDLVSVEVSMDKDKARLLLGAMLSSQTVLTDVFRPKQAQRKKRKHNY